jgi:hypothetical protein
MSDIIVRAIFRVLLPALAGALLAGPADARGLPETPAVPIDAALRLPGGYVVQQDGMSLSEAVESVRRQGDVERVISAETRVSNGREVHYIRVMTKDGKVKTVKMNGRKLN